MAVEFKDNVTHGKGFIQVAYAPNNRQIRKITGTNGVFRDTLERKRYAFTAFRRFGRNSFPPLKGRFRFTGLLPLKAVSIVLWNISGGKVMRTLYHGNKPACILSLLLSIYIICGLFVLQACFASMPGANASLQRKIQRILNQIKAIVQVPVYMLGTVCQ